MMTNSCFSMAYEDEYPETLDAWRELLRSNLYTRSNTPELRTRSDNIPSYQSLKEITVQYDTELSADMGHLGFRKYHSPNWDPNEATAPTTFHLRRPHTLPEQFLTDLFKNQAGENMYRVDDRTLLSLGSLDDETVPVYIVDEPDSDVNLHFLTHDAYRDKSI